MHLVGLYTYYETLPIVYHTKIRVRLTKLASLSQPFIPAKLYGYATITQYISQSLLSYKDVEMLILVIFSIKRTLLQLILKIFKFTYTFLLEILQ